MKKYFINRVNDEGFSTGVLTNNLTRDFIKFYDITWHEEFEEDDRLGQNPTISDLNIGKENAEVWIYEIDPKRDIQSLLGHFNFFKNCESDLIEFIQDNFRRLEMEEIDESIKIHRFRDYK